jgi:hypothetical protein
MTLSHLMPAPCQWSSRFFSIRNPRSAPRFALLSLGAVLARGRRTVTTWIRAGTSGGGRAAGPGRAGGSAMAPWLAVTAGRSISVRCLFVLASDRLMVYHIDWWSVDARS